MYFSFWGQQPHFLGPIYVPLFHDNQSILYFETENKFDFVIFTLSNHYIKNVYMRIKKQTPVGWGCRIHRLHLCRGVRSPQLVSWI